MEFESVFPTSSASVAANQKIATALASEIFSIRAAVSGLDSEVLYETASFVHRQYITCLIHLVQDVENWKKYVTSVEHSFRKTRGPSEFSIHLISQPRRVCSNA